MRRKLNRREFLKAAGAGAVTAGVMGAAGPRHLVADPPGRAEEAAPAPETRGGGPDKRRPNIVFVFPDQHRNCSWPGGGDPQVKAPNLEAMAREGAVFTRCISNHPLCSPYRASLLTGRYQQAHTVGGNVGANGSGLPLTEVTLADVLKKAGYATGYVGKWHLYAGWESGKIVPPGPHRHGFDYWRVCYNYRNRYATRYYDDAGKEITIDGYAPKGQMDLVLEFVEKNAAKPFCVFLSWHPPHPPYKEAPKRFADLYPVDQINLRPNVPKGEQVRRVRENQVEYFAHISAMDEEVGRLMKKLAELHIADHTIVCYSSDHGDMLGSFDRWGKNVPWDEAINVPFIIRWPGGIPAGRRLDTLFATVDITPTLLGLAGEAVLPQMQGVDLSAILKGKDAPGPESAFIMSGPGATEGEEEEGGNGTEKGKGQGKLAAKKGGGKWRGLRTPRYTYAKAQEGNALKPWLLYDNEKDPHQMDNLAEDPAHADTRKELDAKLHAWLKRVGEA